MSEVLELKSAGELAALIRERKLSSVELLEGCLRRIERLNPALNAVVTLDVERARERARVLDGQLARGDSAGPLHGLPITIKDAYETAGMRTTSGAREWSTHVPAHNALAVQRLLDAGAVVLGKSNVPAYCVDVQTYNELFGTTRNPWDPERTPGGSSGGAAVAVACGMSAFELGSDIGGSIRTPSGWTGVFGHKPTYGIVPMSGHLPPAPGVLAEPDLAVAGPIARSAQDLSLLLDLIAGPNAAQAKAYSFALPAARAHALRDFRVGAWLEDADFPLDGAVARVLEDALLALERAGVRVDRSARLGRSLAAIYDDYLTLLSPNTLMDRSPATLERLASRASKPDEKPRNALIARAMLQRQIDWFPVHERRLQLKARFAELFRSYDVLLCPITPVAAIPHDQRGSFGRRSIAVNGDARSALELMAWISPATACHLPATATPVGRTAQGLPVGMQVIGPYLEDHTPIAFAGLLSELTSGYAAPAVAL
jgi:amidase